MSRTQFRIAGSATVFALEMEAYWFVKTFSGRQLGMDFAITVGILALGIASTVVVAAAVSGR